MNQAKTISAVVLFFFTVSVYSLQAGSAEDARLVTSRDLATHLQKELGGRLKSALTIDGPVPAIGVCQLDAPAIGAQISADTAARVGRTALKVRNPANSADVDARIVLKSFERQMADGIQRPAEHFVVSDDGSARYMKAIVTQPMCLTCHGSDVSVEVATALKQRYPQDRATGFAAGELRGAFIIDWPAPVTP
jgi:hypothetical protein